MSVWWMWKGPSNLLVLLADALWREERPFEKKKQKTMQVDLEVIEVIGNQFGSHDPYQYADVVKSVTNS